MKYHRFIAAFLFSINASFAGIVSVACKPYFASIKSNNVNAHVGPGKEYKISNTYILKGLPIMITARYDHWRKITDPDGIQSWIHKSLLSSRRFVIVVSNDPAELRKNSNDAAEIVAKVKKGVIMSLSSIRGNWCEASVVYNGKKYSGWIQKNAIFGVFENETM